MAADPHAVAGGPGPRRVRRRRRGGVPRRARRRDRRPSSGSTAALEAAEAAGYVGDDVLGSGVTVEIQIRPLEGGFVLGEETVLLQGPGGQAGRAGAAAAVPLRTRPLRGPHRGQQRGHAGERAVAPRQRAGQVPGHRRSGLPGHGPGAAQRRGPPARRRRGAHRHAACRDASTRPAAARPGSSRRPSWAARRAASCPRTAWPRPSHLDALEAAGAILGSGSVLVLDEHACIVELADAHGALHERRVVRQDASPAASARAA